MPETILKERENRILEFIIRDYTRTAEPVSSGRIRQKMGLKESGATVRNIMAELDESGFLAQPHISAGRIPTDRAYRHFVDNLMSRPSFESREMARLAEIAGKEFEKAHHFLADSLKLLSIVGTESNFFSNHGLSHLLKEPEFQARQAMDNLGYFLDNIEEVIRVYRNACRKEAELFIGAENPISRAEKYGVVYLKKTIGGRSQTLMLVGPTRMDYERVSGFVNYFFNA